MAGFEFSRRVLARALPLLAPLLLAGALVAEEKLPRSGLKEPVHRVAARIEGVQEAAAPEHPLDPALRLANDALHQIQTHIRDYTCTLVKRERVGTELGEHQYMFLKVRNRKVENGQVVVPLSAYMYFLKPKGLEGREVNWVEGRNGNKITAHEGSNYIGGRIIGNITVDLDPDSQLAMRGQRYPIYKIGVENLVSELIVKGERDRKHGPCEVTFRKGAKINDRVCTCLQVVHPEQKEPFEFNIARIFIDDELNIPVRYEAHAWPSKEGGKPELLEEYTYLNVKINVGLTDADFDPANPAYNFNRK